MLSKIPYCFLVSLLLLASTAYGQKEGQKIPDKEALLKSIMDVNVDETEALEILAKYYPELLNPVVEAAKDYEKANAVQNAQETGEYYQDLGQRFLEKKDYDQAIIYFQKAILLKKNSQGGIEIHPEISTGYQGIGKAYEGKKDIEKALESYQRGLISNASDFDEIDLLQNPEIGNILSGHLAIPIFESKGDLLLQSGKEESRLLAALIAYERAIEVIDLVCKKYTSEDSKLALGQETVILSEKAIQAALKLYQTTRNPAYKFRAFKLAEKGKAMILTAALLEKGYTPDIPSNIYRKEQQLKITIAQLKQKAKTEKLENKAREQIDKQLFALSETLYFLQDSLKSYYPQAAHLRYTPPSIAIDSLQTFLLEHHAALIEYFIGPNESYVFTLTSKGLEVEKLDEIEEVVTQVISFRKYLQSHDFKKNAEKSLLNFNSHAGALYSLTLEKPLKHVDRSVEELIIVPDAVLWFLPFEILLSDPVTKKKVDFSADHLPYLLNKYAVSYTHSAKLLLNNPKTNDPDKILPFAGFAPEFSGTELASRSCMGEASDLGQLKYNQSELEGIMDYFDGETYFGQHASRKNFLKAVKNADIIHCSTHACLNEDDPMGNRIFFADDEFLTTEHIYLLDMNAKMAVLSACQTGLGHIHNGEGVISLARAFAYAGCSSITMSLWPVADEATAKLMILYYKNLDEGLSKSQALRHAKLEYIETQPKAKQHPYYWAAFVQVGDFSPIKDSKSKGMLFWLLCFGGLVVVASFVNISRRKKIL